MPESKTSLLCLHTLVKTHVLTNESMDDISAVTRILQIFVTSKAVLNCAKAESIRFMDIAYKP